MIPEVGLLHSLVETLKVNKPGMNGLDCIAPAHEGLLYPGSPQSIFL